MGAENQHRAYRNFLDGFYEDCAAAAELVHYVPIVDNFVMDIDWRAIGFEGKFDDIYGADHAGTEAARAYPYQRLGAIRGAMDLRQSQA